MTLAVLKFYGLRDNLSYRLPLMFTELRQEDAAARHRGH